MDQDIRDNIEGDEKKTTKKKTSSIKMMLTMRIVDPAVLESDTVYESDKKSRSMFPQVY